MKKSEVDDLLPAPGSPLPRSALSLTEVLISMGILTLGLLGVASVFPVGSFYMQKAEISDKGSAIAQSVMNDLVAHGMLNPQSWYVMTPVGPTPVYNTTFTSDGAASPNGKVLGTFTRPFARTLNEALNQPNVATDKTILARQFGSAYVLDPLGVSVMAARSGAVPPPITEHGAAAVFPATAYNGYAYHAGYPTWPTSTWLAWCGPSGGASTGYEWPIRRVTFRQPSTGWQMDATMAEHYFRGNDDLSYDFPARDDRPAIQTWDTAGSIPLARKWAGDYSWIATVAPSTNAARDGMATNPEGYAYDVSVVVFYKRVLPENADVAYPLYNTNGGVYQSVMNQNERAVKANVVSTGLNGGELLLSDYGDYRDVSSPTTPKYNAFEHLKSGHWIMLCGPHPNSSTSEPRFVMNWYQVISIEPAVSTMNGYDSATNGQYQRAVTVRGAEWPWQPADPKIAANNLMAANDLCVAICKGAVAVHSKTMRLEGRASATSLSIGGAANGGSGGSGGFGSSGNSTSAPPPYVAY